MNSTRYDSHASKRRVLVLLAVWLAFLASSDVRASDEPAAQIGARAVRPFLDEYCLTCHDAVTKKGGLDLENLPGDLEDAESFRTWVKIHDRIRSGEMPPAKRRSAPRAETDALLGALDGALATADRMRQREGRAVFRRLNRTEYENSLRDLLALPGLNVRDLLPEDGRAHGFDKVGTALDLSSVQLNKYLEAADHALDLAIAPIADRPRLFHKRLYPAFEYSFGHLLIDDGDAVLLKDLKYDQGAYPVIRDPATMKAARAKFEQIAKSYQGSVGVFRHTDQDNQLSFKRQFAAHYPGRYRLKFSTWGFRWDGTDVKPGRGIEVVSMLASGRLLGYFDAPSLKPTVHEIEIWLNAKETVEFNAASLWPKVSATGLPNSTAGLVAPGIAFDWLEIEGPLNADWPPTSHRRLFGDLPLGPMPDGATRRPRRQALAEHWFWPDPPQGESEKYTLATVASKAPLADAERLLATFLPRAFRRPVPTEEVRPYVEIVAQRLAARSSFEEAMRTAYKAALCSASFLLLKETPGRLDAQALTARLSYFLWNSTPDDELTSLAANDRLRDPTTLRGQVERMLADPRAGRFVDDFPDQWLGLREINATTPDSRLYPEFSTVLRDSMLDESRAYFRELLHKDLGVAYLVQSDFAMLNQRLAELYAIPGVTGSAIRRVALPADAHRGGFLTQASVLKVTANGTTTTPVKRGVWVQSRILGRPPEPPPPNVAAVEPDVRGATTIREQLAKHRAIAACAGCHAKIDPPGFALESYDPIGGWRQRYRSLDKGEPVANRFTSLGRPVDYRLGPTVDPSGELAGGRAFADVAQLQKLLVADERQLARNFVGQLLVYATGAPVTYADRAAVEQILDSAKSNGYGLRTLIHAVVQSPLFQNK